MYLVGGVLVVTGSGQRRRPPSGEFHDQSSRANRRYRAAASGALRARHRGDSHLSNHACRRNVVARTYARLGERREHSRRRWFCDRGQRLRTDASSRTNDGAHAARRRRLADSLLDRRLHRSDSVASGRFGARFGLRRSPHRLERHRITRYGGSDERAAIVSECFDRLAAAE